jgi:hypothetical protein
LKYNQKPRQTLSSIFLTYKQYGKTAPCHQPLPASLLKICVNKTFGLKLICNFEKRIKMDLQTRKLNFIQDFIKLENEKSISHLEKLLQKETQNNSNLKPMTMKEFQNRIDQSSEDSQNGRLTENSKLISEIEKWS